METKTQEKGLKIGTHQLPKFDGMSAVFGAERRDYPTWEEIPKEFTSGNRPYNRVVSSLFFKGGRLEDYGLTLKAGIDKAQAMTALKALLSSFAPKHEVKEATVAWALSEWCDGTPKAA